jgi:hypothetical protein
MVPRSGEAAKLESAKRAEELAADGDLAGVAVLLRIIDAPVHSRSRHLAGLCIRRLFGRMFPLIE